MDIYDDLGYGQRMSVEQKEQAKEYTKMMSLYRAKQDKPKTERQIAIDQGRF